MQAGFGLTLPSMAVHILLAHMVEQSRGCNSIGLQTFAFSPLTMFFKRKNNGIKPSSGYSVALALFIKLFSFHSLHWSFKEPGHDPGTHERCSEILWSCGYCRRGVCPGSAGLGPTQDTELVICETNTSDTCSPLETMVSPTLEQLPFSWLPHPKSTSISHCSFWWSYFPLVPRAP